MPIASLYACSSQYDSAAMVEELQSCFQQGEQLANQGFYEAALVQFDRIVERQPDAVSAWIFRAVMLLHLDRYSEALESCDRALTLSPADPEAWLFRGVALHRLHRYPEAYASYEKALGDPVGLQASVTGCDRANSPSWLHLPSLPSGNWLASLWHSLRGWASS